ncbi:MAG: tRNA (5-methylaminomethyl-2-thiouridine)(34)-methyltransferase MnmD [Pseudomonadota bacterium]
MEHKEAEILWGPEGQPISARFDDPYFSLDDGLAETRHVFLEGNALRDRLQSGFHIAELGFGTGLNLLATVQLAERLKTRGRIRFTSFEAFPMQPAEIRRAMNAFPDLAGCAQEMMSHLDQGTYAFALGPIDAEIILGDARTTLTGWPGYADAWFLDGFSPAKNPELWSPEMMRMVADRTKAGGTFATYTAAGEVRRALETAGFAVERIPGFGRKRHMTRGKKVGPR